MKTALICGVSGQDGAYLANLLLKKNYRVIGTSRDAQMNSFSNLKKLGIQDSVEKISMDLGDFRSVIQAIKHYKPGEIYNLAGQSSVGLSFEQPMETMESVSLGTLNLLESIRFHDYPIRLYNAGSGECFGDTGDHPADEETPFRPRSPYAVAKAAAYWASSNYREAYNLYSCTGILFNHESPLRAERFVTQKIICGASRIRRGDMEKLRLGNIDIKRDWGWAPQFVHAMWQMMQLDEPQDLVIATGQNHSLKEFIDCAFTQLGMDWREHVIQDEQFVRPTDISSNRGNPSKAEVILGWKPQYYMEDVVKKMLEATLSQ